LLQVSNWRVLQKQHSPYILKTGTEINTYLDFLLGHCDTPVVASHPPFFFSSLRNQQKKTQEHAPRTGMKLFGLNLSENPGETKKYIGDRIGRINFLRRQLTSARARGDKTHEEELEKEIKAFEDDLSAFEPTQLNDIKIE